MKNLILFSAVATVLILASCRKDNSVTFWTASNCSANAITVTINGQSMPITEYYGKYPPSCGSAGCATFNLAAGKYNYTATDGDTTWQGNVTVSRTGCTLVQLTCSSYTGNVTFWTANNIGSNKITVTVDSLSAVIYRSNTSAPACGSNNGNGGNGSANFALAPGTYTYTASSADTAWQGSVTVTKGACTTQQLSFATGNVSFWIDSAATNITVSLDSMTNYINTAFPGGVTSCGTTGCANFTVHVGTHSYTAITSANVGYTGNVTVTNNGCSLVKLF